MSFICAITGKHIKGKPTKLILTQRDRIYPARSWKYTKSGIEYKQYDPGGKGYEITKEFNCAPGLTAEQILVFLRRNE